MSELIYIASPYSHPDPAVRQARYEQVTEYAAKLARAGRIVYAPISMCHALVQHGAPTDAESWAKFNGAYIDICIEAHVLLMPGWSKSAGVRAEIEAFRLAGKSITYVHPVYGECYKSNN